VNDKSTKVKIISIHDILREVVDGHYLIYVDCRERYRELDGEKTVRGNDLKNNQELVYGKPSSICRVSLYDMDNGNNFSQEKIVDVNRVIQGELFGSGYNYYCLWFMSTGEVFHKRCFDKTKTFAQEGISGSSYTIYYTKCN
jgi:hypothetical protein